uniref:Uncharacterized protein n=1 Tax=Panagrolaimus davidi TaxID=227884 RepID=A0A914PSS3_9BILA
MKRVAEVPTDATTSEEPSSNKRSRSAEVSINDILSPVQDLSNSVVSDQSLKDINATLKEQFSALAATASAAAEKFEELEHLKKENKILSEKIQQLEATNLDTQKIAKNAVESKIEQCNRHDEARKKWEAERDELLSKIKEVEDELCHTVKSKKDEIGGLKNRLEEVHQQLSDSHHQIEKLEKESKIKADQIVQLKKESEAGKEKRKKIQHFAFMLESERIANHLEKSDIQRKNENLKSQLSKAESTAAKEKENYEKTVCHMKTEKQQMRLLNAKFGAEKEKAEKDLAELQSKAERDKLRLQQIFKDVYSNICGNSHESSPSSSSSSSAPTTALPPVSSSKKGMLTITSLPTHTPKWIVSKEICQACLESHPDAINFLKHYIIQLFSRAELLLPEESLEPSKWKEAKNVLFHFFNPEQKSIYTDLLKKEMASKRYHLRSEFYKLCSQTRAVGITNTGTKVYFLHQTVNGKWEPFSDIGCSNPLPFTVLTNSDFCYPTDPSSNFIVIVQCSVNYRCIYKMTSCFDHCVFKHRIGGEKKPKI